jgi:putative flippase GtrA
MGKANRIGPSATLWVMSNLDRQRGYTPRRAREQRAYRLAMVGGTAGVVGVVTLILAVVGVITWALPIIALIVAAICMYAFQRTTAQR